MREEKPLPGDGIRSLKTSALFRTLNFELFTRPNKVVMAVGATVFLACLGYISYMRHKYESLGYYAAVKEDGVEHYYRKRSNWD